MNNVQKKKVATPIQLLLLLHVLLKRPSSSFSSSADGKYTRQQARKCMDGLSSAQCSLVP
jgi:hypothetical protein